MIADAGLRTALIAAGRRMNAAGLNQGTSGNLSARTEGGFLVTPTGMPYEALEPEDIVHVGAADEMTGRRAPSSEWQLHRDVLAARPDAGAVLHAHPMFATTLACLGRGIPPFHYMVAAAGAASIPCAPYATFGTEALSRHAADALRSVDACLLAHHGFVVVAKTVEKSLALAIEVETLAAMYWRALQIGEPALLDDEEMARVLEKFKTYGQQP